MDLRTYIGPPGCVEVRGPRGRAFAPGETVDFAAVLLEGHEATKRAPQTWAIALEHVAHLFVGPSRDRVTVTGDDVGPLELADPERLTTRDGAEPGPSAPPARGRARE